MSYCSVSGWNRGSQNQNDNLILLIMYNPQKAYPKSIQQIVQEMVFEELLARDHVYSKNNSINHSIRNSQKVSVSQNKYNNYITQFNNQKPQTKKMIIDGLKMGGRKPPVQNSSIKKLMSIVQSNTPHANNNISRSKPFQRGISISDHLSNQTPILPIISKKVSQRELQISDSAFEGYKLVSEEMSFEIDEYVRLQNTKLLLPPIN